MEGSTKEERKVVEQEWINRYFDNGKQCYNLKQKVTLSREDVPSKDPEKTILKLREHGLTNEAIKVSQFQKGHAGNQREDTFSPPGQTKFSQYTIRSNRSGR